ncbi:MAG: hypothetical protein OXI24_12230 [Candidatus Poribacteria bacterium]|nr:hypothetical protein [Candidatus Poribacteria bacterium]
MKCVKQYEITLETGEKKIINDTHLKNGHLYYTELGPGFGMESIAAIRVLPQERILDTGNRHTPKSRCE